MFNCAFKKNLILFFNCNLTDNLFLTVKKGLTWISRTSLDITAGHVIFLLFYLVHVGIVPTHPLAVALPTQIDIHQLAYKTHGYLHCFSFLYQMLLLTRAL